MRDIDTGGSVDTEPATHKNTESQPGIIDR